MGTEPVGTNAVESVAAGVDAAGAGAGADAGAGAGAGAGGIRSGCRCCYRPRSLPCGTAPVQHGADSIVGSSQRITLVSFVQNHRRWHGVSSKRVGDSILLDGVDHSFRFCQIADRCEISAIQQPVGSVALSRHNDGESPVWIVIE